MGEKSDKFSVFCLKGKKRNLIKKEKNAVTRKEKYIKFWMLVESKLVFGNNEKLVLKLELDKNIGLKGKKDNRRNFK